jgi:mannose-6-phosphate isomerase-like protein (cupin superfamily)
VNLASHAFEVEQVRRRLEAGKAGTRSCTPLPASRWGSTSSSRPSPTGSNRTQTLYAVLGGRGVLKIEGEAIPVEEGQAIFVPAGADHQFTAYEGLSVLVIFARPRRAQCLPAAQPPEQ